MRILLDNRLHVIYEIIEAIIEFVPGGLRPDRRAFGLFAKSEGYEIKLETMQLKSTANTSS